MPTVVQAAWRKNAQAPHTLVEAPSPSSPLLPPRLPQSTAWLLIGLQVRLLWIVATPSINYSFLGSVGRGPFPQGIQPMQYAEVSAWHASTIAAKSLHYSEVSAWHA